MIKLNSHKDSLIQFDVDVKNVGDGNLKGYLRLVHESIEYGFPVDINGRRAKVTIPALNKVIPGLSNKSIIEAKMEFMGGSDYVQAWSDTVEAHVPPKVEVKMAAAEKLDVSIDTSITIEEDKAVAPVKEAVKASEITERSYDDLPDEKLKKLYNQMKDEQLSAIAAQQFKMIVKVMKKRKLPLNETAPIKVDTIEVPDTVWAAVKPRPKLTLTEEEQAAETKRIILERCAAKKSINGKKGGFNSFFAEAKTKVETEKRLGHYHTAELDDEGDGVTTDTFPHIKNTKGHVHKIVGAEVQPEQKKLGHTHPLKG